jgi:hypothetical protein
MMSLKLLKSKSLLATALAVVSSTVLCFGQTASFTAQPFADAFVTPGATGSLSTSNFGGAGSLAIAAPGLPQGEFQSVLQFDLSAAQSSFNAQFGAGQWTVQSVTLQLTSSPHNNAIFNNIAAGQFNVSLMQNNSWVEGTGTGGIPSSDGISFSSLQGTYINGATDQALGTFSFPGGSSGQNSYALTLSSGLVSDVATGGDLSLRLFAADNAVSYLMTARSGSSTARPDILIQAVVVPEPSTVVLCAAALAALWLVQTVRRWTGRKS